jgi:hypothetical protein
VGVKNQVLFRYAKLALISRKKTQDASNQFLASYFRLETKEIMSDAFPHAMDNKAVV